MFEGIHLKLQIMNAQEKFSFENDGQMDYTHYISSYCMNAAIPIYSKSSIRWIEIFLLPKRFIKSNQRLLKSISHVKSEWTTYIPILLSTMYVQIVHRIIENMSCIVWVTLWARFGFILHILCFKFSLKSNFVAKYVT